MQVARIIRIICGVLAAVLLLAGFVCIFAASYLPPLNVLPGMEDVAWGFIGFGICAVGMGFFAIVMMNTSGHSS